MSKRMKAVLVGICVLGMILVTSTAFAQTARSPGAFGIGLGAATVAGGVSFKTSAGAGTSFQGVVGPWRGHGPDWRWGADSIAFGGDYLFEQPAIASGRALSLGWNYGIGGGIGITDWGAAVAGVTGVIGLEFNFVPAPFDLTIEYRPGLYIGDDFLDPEFIDFTGHIRFWF